MSSIETGLFVVKYQVGTGEPGAPTLNLSLAVNTVARAYRELESAGILETRGRFGTFVARVDPADTAMATAAHAFVSAARALGVDKDDALRYVEAAFG